MYYLLRPINLFVLGTYLALSAVPFIPVLLSRPITQPFQIIGMEFIAWLSIWCIFKRPAWFHWLLIPAFLAFPIELYLQVYYGQGITTHHLGIIAETSPKESLEFLGNQVWLLVVVLLGISAWWWLSWKAARRSRDLDWEDGSRYWIFAFLGIGLCLWIYAHEFGVHAAPSNGLAKNGEASSPAPKIEVKDIQTNKNIILVAGTPSPALSQSSLAATGLFSDPPKLPYWANIPFEFDAFGNAWPFGLIVRTYDFWKERNYLAELKDKSRFFKFGAYQAGGQHAPQIVVMIIGESSRYDRWSLNGYQRETNPLLKTEPNLVSLTNVVTAVSATRLSVPILVSRKPATQSLQAGFSEKSFLTAFKEAGFKTYWLSNQISFGKFDTPVSVFANEADVTQFLNLGSFTNGSSYDQVLLEPLKNAIKDPAEKKLIVLHTLGNHWNYSQRHPQEFDKWQPSLFGMINPAYTDLRLKQQLNNSYDNSILYTDWFLSQVIGTLKSSSQLTSMMYISDHGQTLYDGNCKLAFHGHNTEYEFHVPALVWYSDLYQSAHPAKVAQLRRHQNARLATENVFHSLLDMADIHYGTEQLDRSFLSSEFTRHKRYVDSYGWTDYDNATFKGDCREVIDKGTPLVQKK